MYEAIRNRCQSFGVSILGTPFLCSIQAFFIYNIVKVQSRVNEQSPYDELSNHDKITARVKCEKQPKGYPKDYLHTQDYAYVKSGNYGL